MLIVKPQTQVISTPKKSQGSLRSLGAHLAHTQTIVVLDHVEQTQRMELDHVAAALQRLLNLIEPTSHDGSALGTGLEPCSHPNDRGA